MKGGTLISASAIPIARISSVQFSPLTDWVVGGDMRDDSAEILFQTFLQQALVNGFGMSTRTQEDRSASCMLWLRGKG